MRSIALILAVALFVFGAVNPVKGEDMKASSEWKQLTKTQRRAWSAWAKDNPVLLDDGSVRRVSGRKAMTMVVRNRAIAGEPLNPAALPEAEVWVVNGLSLRDAGPFTTNAGYIGFRAEQNLGADTKWFVWATAPVGADEVNAHRLVRFIACLTPGQLDFDDLTPDLGPAYAAVHGSWDGPGEDGEWPVDTFIWLRVHQYVDGQLGPGALLQGRIQVEL